MNKYQMGSLVKFDRTWWRVHQVRYNPYKLGYEYKLSGYTLWVDEDDIEIIKK